MEAFKKIVASFEAFWGRIPRKLKYFLLGLTLAAFDKKYPGVLPSIDPLWYVGGGIALAAMHTVTDVASMRNVNV